ncbi:MAG TPA: ABC transporter ATP-binding protein [Propionibacteriaceae bacterium]|nr:ABC transporter ATP-binding protein [Propionibacteriaceae bacterium]
MALVKQLIRPFVPRGISLLFSPAVRLRLVLAALGSAFLAFTEAISIAAVLPLVQILTGGDYQSGTVGTLWTVVGQPSATAFTAMLAATVFAGMLIRNVFTLFFRWWLLGFTGEQNAQTASKLLTYYLTAPYPLHLRRGVPDFLRVMNDAVGQVYSQYVGGMMAAFIEFINVALLLGVLLITIPGPTLMMLAYFGLAAFVMQRVVRPRALRASLDGLEASEQTYKASFRPLHGIKELVLRKAWRHFVDEYRSARMAGVRAGRRGAFLSEAPKHIMEIVFVVGMALAVVIIMSTNTSGTAMSILALVMVVGVRTLPSMVRGLASLNSVKAAKPGLNMVLEDLRDAEQLWRREPPNDRPTRAERLRLRDKVFIEDVYFRYPTGTEDVLRGVSLTIPKGHSVAFVGGSGAGKTTLVDIILGLHTPTSGRVLVDDTDIQDRLTDWQASLAMVPQDVYLFDDDLRTNIAFDQRDAEIDDARISEVVAQAELQDLVAKLPQGLLTEIGDRGSRLSGGQRQRVGIARALYRDPSLLVLDEATSALDNETEHHITRTISQLHGDITVVIVAHRLSTVRQCDQVIYLEDGMIAAQGTFDEVRAQSPRFDRLVRLGNLEQKVTLDDLEEPAQPPIDSRREA